MEPGTYIVGAGREGLFEGIDPQQLAGSHPVWQKDVNQFGPWEETEIPANSDSGEAIPAWRARAGNTKARTLVCGRCSSTMDGLRHLIDSAGLAPWDSLIAVEQQKGRGQMTRSWISPPGNLYVSWYWPNPETIPDADAGWRSMASLIAGELVATVLESFDIGVSIKWPNDLLVDDRKVCGILVENRGGHLIVGIGLNLASAPPRERLTDAFALPPVSLREAGLEVTPLEFWRQMQEIGRSRFYSLLASMPPASFIELVKKRLAWQGRRITIRRSRDEAFHAEIVGLGADGGLYVNRDGEITVIYSGSILPAENIQI